MIIIIFSVPPTRKKDEKVEPPPPDSYHEEDVVMVEVPRVGWDGAVEQLSGMVANVAMDRDVSKACFKHLCKIILTIMKFSG